VTEKVEEKPRDVLAGLETSGRAFDAAEPDHERRWLNLDPATGEFLFFLIRATHRRRIFEVGTSNGCSTIWLAMGLKELAADGHVVTVERNAEKQHAAVANLRRAGLACHVKFRLGEATEVAGEVDGPFDCVFFDADRISAHLQLRALLPKLTLDCLLLTDNAVSHAYELRAYFDTLKLLPEFQTLLLPIGKGLHIAYRNSGAHLAFSSAP
jgi:predicted O-methyltransferase YrrM